jgi:uncharacterized protein (TIGR00299 family) protein
MMAGHRLLTAVLTQETTMRVLYLDCFSGAAGDMLLAALIDAGAPEGALHELVGSLKIPDVTITVESVVRRGIAAKQVKVGWDDEAPQPHRHLHHVIEIIETTPLPSRVAERAVQIFERLAQAEATVHNSTIEKVHFHEVGAIDAIVDIVGTCLLIELLNVQRIISSPLPPGSGTVTCEHGVMPVPAPATAQLLRGVPLVECPEPGELVTPTGAAIVTTLVNAWGALPTMRLEQVGVGAGTRLGETRPNIIRAMVGELSDVPDTEQDSVMLLEAQIDDAPGQLIGYAIDQLLAAGALDAYVTPITMKKSRPGYLLTVLCRPADVVAVEAVVFAETTTFGVRRDLWQRSTLTREQHTVSTPYGDLRIKLGRKRGQITNAWPEYDDCVAAATGHSVALRVVQEAALNAWREEQTQRDGNGSGQH